MRYMFYFEKYRYNCFILQNAKLMECCDDLKREEEVLKTDLCNLQTELNLKCQENDSIFKLNNNLKIELDERKQMITELEHTVRKNCIITLTSVDKKMSFRYTLSV